MLAQQVSSAPIQAPPGVDADLRADLVARLNKDLACLLDLTLAYKQAHWNVVGPAFAQLHELFDRFADETRLYADKVAERALALGGVARGTIQEVGERSVLPAFPVEARDQAELLDALARRVDQLAHEIRLGINATSQDMATQDIYIEIARGIEQQRWMLLAHLPGQQANGRAT